MDLGARSCRLALLFVFAVFAGTNAASAASYKYSSYNTQLDGELNGQYVTINTPRSVTGLAGQVELVGASPNSGQNLLVFCLDIYDTLNSSGGTYTVSPLTTSSQLTTNSAGSGQRLSSSQIGEIGSLIVNGDKAITAASAAYLKVNSQTNAQYLQEVSAAVQLAIWDVEYNTKVVNGKNQATGTVFTYTGIAQGTINLANTYVANVESGGAWDVLYYNVSLLTAPGNQSMVYVSPSPLPATLPLFVTGLGALGWLARRRKRKAALATA
jgi:hypothetical protein